MNSLDDALRRLAETSVLLVASDFDGTLSPIVDDPEDAWPLPRARRALAALARQRHTRVAVISGRALSDLEQRIGPLEREMLLVGGHGSEFEPDLAGRLGDAERALLEQVRRAVTTAADGLEGVTVEHKDASTCLHYRRASRECAAEALWRLLRLRDEISVSEDGGIARPILRRGKKVVELSVLEVHKGHALERIKREVGATAMLYVGDDRTDEDAFRSMGAGDVSVKVGRGVTAADYRVDDPAAAGEVFIRLVEARRQALLRSVSVPIDSLGYLSDQRTGALVASSGSVNWLCPERFDRASIFASLLGGPTAGRFTVRPADHEGRGYQRYIHDSLVLETRWPELSVIDYLVPQQDRGTVLVREIVPRERGGRCRIRFAPRPDFARQDAKLEQRDGALLVHAGLASIRLEAPDVAFEIRAEGESDVADAIVSLDDGPVRLVLRCGRCEEVRIPSVTEVARFWREDLDLLELPPRWQNVVRWSAIVLRGLVYRPSGAIVAAATTSLPEVLGGPRNWDYRFCWPRDAAYACDALLRLGSTREAEGFLGWICRLGDAGGPLDLRPLYGVEGETHLVEGELGHLIGYGASQPVRVGNAAAEQLQVDVYGAVIDLAWNYARCGGEIGDRLWGTIVDLIHGVAARWQEPDAGIWEQRHRIRHHVHSKVMAWVAVDRGVRLAERLGRTVGEDWSALRSRIRGEVLDRGWSDEVGAFTVGYESDELDASVLWLVLSGLLTPDDPRAVSTVEVIERSLREGATVYRYRYDDGLAGDEGGFHICTAWLVEALVMIGRREMAEDLFDQMLGTAGPTGILSEMVDPTTGAALGNTPQAYSHTGVIWSALALTDGRSLAATAPTPDTAATTG